MKYNVQTIPEFEKAFKKLLKKYPSLKTDIFNLVLALEENPIIGSSLGNDFYKIRLSITSKGRGKAGGGRVITCVKIIKHTIYLAAIYDKANTTTLTDADLKLLAKKIG